MSRNSWYAKANNKYIKDYDENKEPSYYKYQDVNNLHGWAMSQKINEDFIKRYDEEIDEGFFLVLTFNTLKNNMNFKLIYHFYKKEWILKNSKGLLLTYMIKLNVLFT